MPKNTALLLALVSLWLSAPVVRGQDFRIETDVFVGDQERASMTTLTLFQGNTVYDFLGADGDEITVFDSKRGRFVLLDCQRQVRTSITLEQLIRFAANLKASAEGSSRELVDIDLKLSSPQDGTYVLDGKRVRYRVVSVRPPNPAMVQRYRAFADAYARLNATQVGNLPPFARLKLNELLSRKGVIPQSIERTVRKTSPLKQDHFARTQHLLNWQLTNTDRKRISQAGDFMATYREVAPSMYWK